MMEKRCGRAEIELADGELHQVDREEGGAVAGAAAGEDEGFGIDQENCP